MFSLFILRGLCVQKTVHLHKECYGQLSIPTFCKENLGADKVSELVNTSPKKLFTSSYGRMKQWIVVVKNEHNSQHALYMWFLQARCGLRFTIKDYNHNQQIRAMRIFELQII